MPSTVNLAQIQKRGGEEIMTEIIAEEEEERIRTNQPMTSPNAPMKAPIEPTQEVSYTLIAFTVFSESPRQGHYKAYCKKGDTEWYLFNDEKITKKRGDITKFTTKDNIFTQVILLYYLKNVEATMKKSAEKAQENLV